MSNLVFRGAFIRYADLRKGDEAGVYLRLYLTADPSDRIAEAMEWEPVPDCVESADLAGKLIAHDLHLVPNQQELRQHEINLECNEISGFTLVRIKNKDGETKRSELRFVALIQQAAAVGHVEEYLRVVGKSDGALTISYSDQQQLELRQASDPVTKCDACAAGIPLIEDDPGTHVSGQSCLDYRVQQPGLVLATAREMGGTHAKASRQRKGRKDDAKEDEPLEVA